MGCSIGNPKKLIKPYKKRVSDDSLDGKLLAAFSNEFELKEIIGQGKYGKVILAENIFTKKENAVKVISRKDQNVIKMRKAMRILSEMNHPNIVKYSKYYQTKKYYYIIMEHCAGNDLFQKIMDKEHFTESKASVVTESILKGINYFQNRGIIHRDLKPENIMFDSEGILKIVDFGSFMEIGSSDNEKLVGTTYYMAPEIVKNSIYTKACDIWSLGVILHAMLFGYLPIGGMNLQEICNEIKAYKGPTFEAPEQRSISSEAKNLLKRMLDTNYKTRITVEEALNHPWFKQAKTTMISHCENANRLQNSELSVAATDCTETQTDSIIFNRQNVDDNYDLQELLKNVERNEEGLINCDSLISNLIRTGKVTNDKQLEFFFNLLKKKGIEIFMNETSSFTRSR